LNTLIDENHKLYLENKDLFDNFNIEKICQNELIRFKQKKNYNEQEAILKKAKDILELLEKDKCIAVNQRNDDELEYNSQQNSKSDDNFMIDIVTFFKNFIFQLLNRKLPTTNVIPVFERSGISGRRYLDIKIYENQKIIYEKEYKKFRKIDEKVSDYNYSLYNYYSNRFKSAYKIGSDIKLIIKPYMANLDLINKHKLIFGANDTFPTKMPYIEQNILSEIYDFCNNKYFAYTPKTNFFEFFNLHDSYVPIEKVTSKNYYIYYLIDKMSDKIKNGDKNFWLIEILKRLEIDYETYKKRKKDIHGGSSSVKDTDTQKAKQELIDFLTELYTNKTS